jgi:DNA-directed RNA polymerase
MHPQRTQARALADQVLDKVTEIVQATTAETSQSLDVNEQVVVVTTLADGADFTVYLPSVIAARGRIYTIRLGTLGDDETVTVADLDDSIDWSDIDDIDAVNDGVVLYSDGMKWHVLLDDVA